MKISLSTNPAENNLMEYIEEISMLTDFIHCDVMDGIFVPNICLSSETVNYINTHTTLPLDVHLMMAYPEKQLDNFIQAGANIITIHYESYIRDLVFEKDMFVADLKKIRENKCLAGISINPNTHVSVIEKYLPLADVVLVMSVYPGESGQLFITDVIKKIDELNEIRKNTGLNFKIEVDGGITHVIADRLRQSGVDIVVSGSYVYNSADKKLAIESLK